MIKIKFSSTTKARQDIREKLFSFDFDEKLKENAVVLIEELHSWLFTEFFRTYSQRPKTERSVFRQRRNPNDRSFKQI